MASVRLSFFLFFLGLLGVFLALAFYPGFPGGDAVFDFNQMSLGIIWGYRPPFYQWLAYFFSWIDPSRLEAGLFLFCLVFYLGSVSIFALHMLRDLSDRILFALVMCCSPALFSGIGFVGTDLVFALFMMLLSTCLLKVEGSKLLWFHFFSIALLSFCALLTRFNGCIAAIPYLFFALKASPYLSRRPIRRAFSTGILIVLLAFLGSKLSRAFVTVESPKGGIENGQQYIMQHDLVGISVQARENLLLKRYSQWQQEDISRLYSAHSGTLFLPLHSPPVIIDPETFSIQLDEYTFHHGKKIRMLEDFSEYQELRRHWLTTIFQNPMAYLSHRWFVMKKLLNLDMQQVCMPYQDSIAYEKKRRETLRIDKGSARYILNRKIFSFFYNWRDSFLFSGWFYLSVHCFFFLFSLFSSRKIPVVFVVMNVSSLLYTSAYFVIAPACFFRYLYWPVVSAHVLAFSVAIHLFGRRQEVATS